MVIRIDKKGNKHLSIQSSRSARKHMKERHTRRDRYAPKKRTKKSSHSIKKSLSSMMGGFF
jgi:predicted RNA-binding protein with RPS1 domain